MFYTVYKTTNIINNKIYIGLHETEDLDDSYLGSGILLKQSIKKYGSNNFKKEILFVYNNKTEMINKEKELVSEAFINRRDTYNLSKGGFGMSTLPEHVKMKAIAKMKRTKQSQDLTIISEKRIKTMLAEDPDCFSKLAAKSATKQKDNYLKGYVNPKQRLDDVIIYNQYDEVMYQCQRIDLTTLCTKHDLPIRVLIKSIQNKGLPLYTTQAPRKEAYVKYTGWYAIYGNDLTKPFLGQRNNV